MSFVISAWANKGKEKRDKDNVGMEKAQYSFFVSEWKSKFNHIIIIIILPGIILKWVGKKGKKWLQGGKKKFCNSKGNNTNKVNSRGHNKRKKLHFMVLDLEAVVIVQLHLGFVVILLRNRLHAGPGISELNKNLFGKCVKKMLLNNQKIMKKKKKN